MSHEGEKALTVSHTKLNVLIVEDSEDDAVLMVRELKRGGYQPEWQRVETPEAMEAALREQEWDVVLSDYQMPHFDGSKALALLQDTGQDLPFIVISGAVGEKTTVELMKAGAADFLLKDSLARLVPAVRRELKEAENRQRHLVAEKALHAERERLSMIIEGSRLGTWVWDIQTNEIILNEQWGSMLGYTLEELTPFSYETWAALVHPEDFCRVTEQMAKCLREEIPEYECECRLRCKDGSWGWVEARARIMTRDAQGRPQAMFGTHTDITIRKQAVEKLAASEKELLAAQNIAHLGNWSMDLATNQTTWSEQLYELFRADPSLAIPPFTEHQHLFAPESWERLRASVERARETGIPYELELEIVREDGSRAWAWTRGEAIEDAAGNIVSLRGIAQDISDRKQAENMLRTTHERLEVVIAGGGLGTWEWFPPEGEQEKAAGKLVFNDRWQNILGYEPGEIAPTLEAAHALIDPEALPRIQKLMRAHLNGETPYYEAIYPMHHKSGSWVWIHDRGQVIERYSDGSPRRVCGTHADVTPLMRAEQEVRESEAKFRSYIEQAPYGVFITDATGHYRETNPATSKITGYTQDELLGMHISSLIPSDGQEVLATYFARLTGQGDTEGVLPFVQKNGERGLWTLTAVRLDKDRFLGFVQDITERQSLEEQLRQSQKMESMGRLAGGIAHDLNNTLSVIMGFAEMGMENLKSDEPLFDDFNEIYKAGSRSADIVGQLLAFARKQTIAPIVLDLNDSIENTLKMLRRLIGEDIEIVWLPGANLRPVKIDPAQIDQILTNLCVNARDAITDVGKVTIETKNIRLDDDYCANHKDVTPGEFVMLVVSDNGFGIDPEIIDNIFEPFFTTKSHDKGTGLGLATVYGIARQNGGSINVHSEVGSGTAVTFYLPAHLEEKVDEGRKNEQLPGSCNNETIVIVEDDPLIMKLCELMLKNLGYGVLPVSHPDEAVEMVKNRRKDIDLLLTNVIMPEMNGRELSETLQGIVPGMKTLFMSDCPPNIIDTEDISAEGLFFIQKPLVLKELAVMIRKVLASARNFF